LVVRHTIKSYFQLAQAKLKLTDFNITISGYFLAPSPDSLSKLAELAQFLLN
jgi:hypothetical protein